jgi:hypothetical protein
MSKPGGWIKAVVVVLALCCAALAIAAIYLTTALGEATGKLERVETRLADLAHPDGATKSAFDKLGRAGAELSALKEQNAKLADRIDALQLKLRSTDRRLDSIEAGDLEDLGIDELVDQRLSQRIVESRKKLGERRRPTVERLAEYLGLSAGQQQRVTGTIDRAKDDVWELLNEQRADGRTLVDDLSETFNSPLAPEAKKKQLLKQLFQEGPPGTEDSYFTKIMEIRSGALDDFYGILDDGQQGKFKGMGIDPFGIQTGYSPFRDEVWKAVMGGQ